MAAELKSHRQFLIDRERTIFLDAMYGRLSIDEAQKLLAHIRAKLSELAEYLCKLNIRELKRIATGSGIRGYSRLRKKQLIAALSS
jgi:hypothetical protein